MSGGAFCFWRFIKEYFLIRIDIIRICDIMILGKGVKAVPSKPKDLEKKILADGWVFKEQNGSHRHYVHPTKPGKVTIPFHKGKELSKITELSILRQAGLKK